MMKEVVTKRYLALAVEPIHIGGDRNSLAGASSTARDVDGFPYIPASSLKGSVRSLCSTSLGVEGCDGKGWHCPQPHRCASCSIFGFSNYHHGSTASSLVRFSSVTMILIPIQSEFGVIWVTSWHRLRQAGVVSGTRRPSEAHWLIAEKIRRSQAEWLMKAVSEEIEGSVDEIKTTDWFGPNDLRDIYHSTIVVDEYTLASLARYFTGLSTSVSIDSKTGRVRNGALFATEHINRMTVLAFEVTFVNPIVRGIRGFINTKGFQDSQIPADIAHVEKIIQTGLDKLGFYGIGGKRSRGYGRLMVWENSYAAVLPEEQDFISTLSVPVNTPHVFISYTSSDKVVARRMAADLQAEHLEVWLDERKILVGDSIHRRVEEGISECDYLVLLVSQESLESAWVQEELNAIRTREKADGRIILLPAILHGVDITKLPTLLRDRRFAQLSPKYEDGLRDIVDSIREHIKRKN